MTRKINHKAFETKKKKSFHGRFSNVNIECIMAEIMYIRLSKKKDFFLVWWKDKEYGCQTSLINFSLDISGNFI